MATAGVTAVERALSIIECFRKGDRTLSLPTLAERTGLNKATIIRLIVSLEKYGYVVRVAPGTYALGATFMHYSGIYQESWSLSEYATPILRELMRSTGNSTALFVRHGDTRLCLYRVNSDARLVSNIREGEHRDLLPGGSGKVLLAWSADEAERMDWADVRAAGYAINHGERHSDVSSIAAPVFRENGELLGAITVSGPSPSVLEGHQESHIPKLLAAARALSRRLGAPPNAA
jgi:DNA-binding IclR family transcriptional regulator